MGHVPLLDELAVIAALAVGVTLLLARLKLPTVAGLLAAGALAGPFGLGMVHSVAAIEVLAEVGVVLLLFTIGLEFSLARLAVIFRQVAVGGLLQVVLTAAAVAGVAVSVGEPPGRALFYGFVFALSSTAIVLRALSERRELDAPHGRFIVGTLIFQDLLVVPMVLVVPLLGPAGGQDVLGALGGALARAAGVVLATLAIARLLVPRVLGFVAAAQGREVFLLAILGLCIGTAWLTSLAGLSLALGAFLGGMVVADTEYGHRAMGDILPLRDAFVSVFFVSLGMLFDPAVVTAEPVRVAVLLAGFLVLKGFLATLSALAMKFPSRVAWLAGVGLAQFGEFGFVLAKLAEKNGVVGTADVKPLFAAGIASMFLTPLLVRAAPHVTAGEKLLGPLERLLGVRGMDEASTTEGALEDHVVVVGYGVAGRLTSKALAACGLPFVVVSLNAEAARAGRAEGVPVYYGDATSEETLSHAHLAEARTLVVLINDALSAQRIIDTARRLAPGVPVLARTHYVSEREGLLQVGAREVVAEEVEGAAEILVRLLRWAECPRNVIDERLRELRAESQPSDRKRTLPRPSLGEMKALSDLKIEVVQVVAGAEGAGRSPKALSLRSRTGALVVAVRRGEKLLEQPDPAAPFEVGDVVYLVGTSEACRAAMAVLSDGETFNPRPA
ncbi:MAG: hypothetical protein RL653_2042 [Pseudomonadota bacterium]|jgi:CPA2 family monovalent cation:H+ antiporter-2